MEEQSQIEKSVMSSEARISSREFYGKFLVTYFISTISIFLAFYSKAFVMFPFILLGATIFFIVLFSNFFKLFIQKDIRFLFVNIIFLLTIIALLLI